MEGTRAAGRRPFMPASRILEGSLPVQHPSGHIFFGGATTTRNGVRAGYQGRSPWLVSVAHGIPRVYSSKLRNANWRKGKVLYKAWRTRYELFAARALFLEDARDDRKREAIPDQLVILEPTIRSSGLRS